MTAQSRLPIAIIASLLLALTLTASMGHIHNDVSAEPCTICAFNNHSDALVATAALPLAVTAAPAPEATPLSSPATGHFTHYLSRAPPQS